MACKGAREGSRKGRGETTGWESVRSAATRCCLVGALCRNADRRWKTNDNLRLFAPRGYFRARQMFGLSGSDRRLIVLPGGRPCSQNCVNDGHWQVLSMPGLGMCPARTTNPPFISSSARPGEGQYGRVEGGVRGKAGGVVVAEVEQCLSEPGLHTPTSGGSASNAVAVKFYPRHFKSKARWRIYFGAVRSNACSIALKQAAGAAASRHYYLC